MPIKTTKLRINLTGVDSGSPKSSPKGNCDEETSGEAPLESSSAGQCEESSAEEKLAQELKLYKPRLVGRKLVNCPPKHTGKEESGLCVIC